MTLKSQALLPQKTTFDGVDQRDLRFARVASAGLTTSYTTSNVSCTADQIVFIDRIVGSIKTLDTGFTINGALSGGSVTSIVTTESVALRTYIPDNGTITLLRADGTYSEHAYTDATTTAFTIASTDFSSNNCLDNTPAVVGGVNLTLSMEINGRVLEFHDVSEPLASHTTALDLSPQGNMVLLPSQSLRLKSNAAGSHQITIYYRKYQLSTARQLGLIAGGQLPQVASSTSSDNILATTLSSGTETAVVMTTAIPTWMPATGNIAIERDAGTYTVHAYTSYTGSTFTIASTNFGSDNATSTNAIQMNVMTSGGTMTIVNPLAGHAIQIMGFYLTGHNYSATAGDFAMGFWDGTGTFWTSPATKDAGAHMVMVGHVQGRSGRHSPRTMIDNTDGCIEGPTGYGLYVEASANVIGVAATTDPVTPHMSYVVMYRYVKVDTVAEDRSLATALSSGSETAIVVDHAINTEAPPTGNVLTTANDGTIVTTAYTSYTGSTFTIASKNFSGASAIAAIGNVVTYDAEKRNVNDPKGDTPQTTKRRKKWWASTIAAPHTLGASDATDVIFTTATNEQDALVKIKGYASSATGRRTGAADGVTTLGLGATILSPAHAPLTGSVGIADANATDAAADASFSVSQDDLVLPVALLTVPCFIGFQSAAGDINARFQLAWGEMVTEQNPAGLLSLIS